MTIAFYRQLAQTLKTGPVVLATVINTKGSVPREIGAKMIITPSGQIFNTIGGGAGEAKVIHQAQAILQSGFKQMVEIDLSGSPNRPTQGICGGGMLVWLEVWQGVRYLNIVSEILTLLQSGHSIKLVTPFAADKLPYLSNSEPQIEGFSETISPPPTLLIIGAGHVGEQLAKIAFMAGFEIVIFDDRTDWANFQRYPQACLILNDFLEINKLANYYQLYAALVTRGYQQDLQALELLLNRAIPCQYIGMIGSEKRVRMVYQALQNKGISAELFKSIYGPIGLDIGALTPEEIAVSITAELIKVRRGGSGDSLSANLSGQKISFSSHSSRSKL